MGLGANMTDPQRQARLRALERLALRFLVAAQHQRLLRRLEIKSDDVPELLLKLFVIRQFEGPREMRFDVIGHPQPLHARRRYAGCARHPAGTPTPPMGGGGDTPPPPLLHRPRWGGGVTACSITCCAAPSGSHGLRPRPGASVNPASPSLAKRPTQRFTDRRDRAVRSAICCCVRPSALSRMISERQRSRTDTVLARTRRRNSAASSGRNSILGRAMM